MAESHMPRRQDARRRGSSVTTLRVPRETRATRRKTLPIRKRTHGAQWRISASISGGTLHCGCRKETFQGSPRQVCWAYRSLLARVSEAVNGLPSQRPSPCPSLLHKLQRRDPPIAEHKVVPVVTSLYTATVAVSILGSRLSGGTCQVYPMDRSLTSAAPGQWEPMPRPCM